MNTKMIAGILSCLVMAVTIELIRREKLTFKYAFGWLLVSGVAVFFVVFDKSLEGWARWFGFELASNFVFFVLLCFFVFLSLLLTTFLCQQDIRNETIAQKIGILEMEVAQLREQSAEKS